MNSKRLNMIVDYNIDKFHSIPNMNWIKNASPISEIPIIAKELGVSYFAVKRDDLIEPLFGGSKPRKLDYILAVDPYKDAKTWISVGAIGSGHLVAMTSAAQILNRQLEAKCFWEPLSFGVLENLAFIASGPTNISFYKSRAGMAINNPNILLGLLESKIPVVPPGGTSNIGIIGMIKAGFELAKQIQTQEIPQPDKIYLSLGSGGTLVGISLGLAIFGIKTQIMAVSCAEKTLTTKYRINKLIESAKNYLKMIGVIKKDFSPTPFTIIRSQVGAGYGIPSKESISACEKMKEHGLRLEPIYTGKTFSSILSDYSHNVSNTKEKILYWHTAHNAVLPSKNDWQNNIPKRLRNMLNETSKKSLTRRKFIIGLGAISTSVLFVNRISGYKEIAKWNGSVLHEWEANVIIAASEVLLPPASDDGKFNEIPHRIDNYLASIQDSQLIIEIHAMIGFIEHGTLLDLNIPRFTSLDHQKRKEFLDLLTSKGSLYAQISGGIRALCMLGYYQQESTWSDIKYDGPIVKYSKTDLRNSPNSPYSFYEQLKAPIGVLPKGVIN